MSDSLWLQGLYPTSLLCPWDSPGKNTWLPCPSPGDLPHPGIGSGTPVLAGRFFTVWATREAHCLNVTHLGGRQGHKIFISLSSCSLISYCCPPLASPSQMPADKKACCYSPLRSASFGTEHGREGQSMHLGDLRGKRKITAQWVFSAPDFLPHCFPNASLPSVAQIPEHTVK